MTQLSGTAPGRHYLWQWPADGLPFPTGANLHDTHIDARGCDALGGVAGQFVAAPSRNARGPYRWLEGHAPWEVEAALLPPAWLDWCRNGPKTHEGNGRAEGPAAFTTGKGDRPTDEDRCRMVLEAIDVAVQGQNGHGKLLYAARCCVRGFCLDDATSFRLLWDVYSPRCKPPWKEGEEDDIWHKVKEARKVPFNKEWGWLRDAGEADDTVKKALADQPRGDTVHLTDRGNAQLLARDHGEGLRWVTAWHKWLRWDGTRWAPSSAEEVRGKGAAMLKSMFRSAGADQGAGRGHRR